MKEENLEARIKLKNLLDLYEKTIDKARYLSKRYLPLHRKLKKVYRQKRAFQAKIGRLNAKFETLQGVSNKKEFRYVSLCGYQKKYQEKMKTRYYFYISINFFHGLLLHTYL
jgi:hypothetical protein